jgi:hypothetical protein
MQEVTKNIDSKYLFLSMWLTDGIVDLKEHEGVLL